MVDGVNVLMTLFHSALASDIWAPARASNFLDGAAPYYCCYETSDGKYVSLGAIEKPFMKLFVEKASVSEELLQGHGNPSQWPELCEQLEAIFKTRTQAQWCELLEGSDACFVPVIPFGEASQHPHQQARHNFIEVDGVTQPASRFSVTPAEVSGGLAEPGQHSNAILAAASYSQEQIEHLLNNQVVA